MVFVGKYTLASKKEREKESKGKIKIPQMVYMRNMAGKGTK